MLTKKFSVLLVCVLFVFSLIFSTANVQALSDEVTGLNVASFQSNQGAYCQVGNYYCFATYGNVLVYESDGSLYASYSTASQGNTFYHCRVIAVNSTHLLYGAISGHGSYYGSRIDIGYLNVGTGVYTSVSSFYCSNGGSPGDTDCVLVNINGAIYFVYLSYVGNGYYYFNSLRIYPTTSGSFAWNGGSLITSAVLAPMIYVPSSTSTNEGYLVGKGPSGTNRFAVAKINAPSGTYSYVGVSGVDNTWGANFDYYIGSSYDSDGSSHWYDVGVSYDCGSAAKQLGIQVCRFNDTALSYTRIVAAPESPVNIVRPYSVSWAGIGHGETLTEDGYRVLYVGTYYDGSPQLINWGNPISAFGTVLANWVSGSPLTMPSGTTDYMSMEFYFDIDNLNTASPTMAGDSGFLPTPNGQHHYQTSTNIGGLQPFNTTLWLQLDIENGKAIASGSFDNIVSYNPAYNLLFWLTPTPIHLVQSDHRAVCFQGVTYAYNAQVYINQVVAGNGSFTVEVTGLSTSYTVDQTGAYSYTGVSGSIVNGVFNFTFSPRTAYYVTVYQGVRVNTTINGAVQSTVHKFVWTTNPNEDGLTPTGTPQPNNGGSTTTNPYPTDAGGAAGFGSWQLTQAFFPMVLFGVIPLAGAIFAGFAGMLIAWNGVGIVTVMGGLVPPYVIIIVVLADVVVLFLRPQFETVTSRLQDRVRGRGGE